LVLFEGLNRSVQQPMTVEAMQAQQRAQRTYVLLFETNGIFRVDNVPPGQYTLSLNPSDPEDEYYNRHPIGSLIKITSVPDEPNARVNAPYDIGALELTIHPRVKLGATVPPFEAKTSDGKVIKLSDFRGKPVLLHFWGLNLGYSSYDLQVLKEFNDNYAAAGKLAIIGYNLDTDARRAEQFASNQGMNWTQTYLGNWSETPVSAMFGVNGNSVCVLVDAEGKVAAGNLRSSALRTALSNAMSGE
jgi:thiol-disulfide isomerase/thioredoxin